MAFADTLTVGGVIRAGWDDATETYQEFDAAGWKADGSGVVTFTRGYTTVELARKAERSARLDLRTNDANLRSKARPIIAEAVANQANLRSFESGTGGLPLDQLTTVCRRIAGALADTNALSVGTAKVLLGALENDDLPT